MYVEHGWRHETERTRTGITHDDRDVRQASGFCLNALREGLRGDSHKDVFLHAYTDGLDVP